MTMTMSRRRFLEGIAQVSLTAGLAPRVVGGAQAATAPARTLTIGTRVLEVQGKPATVFGLTEAGRSGLELWRSEGLDVRLVNDGPEPTVIHWHGLTPPFRADGSNVSQPLIAPKASADYTFDLERAGSNWMHSHIGFQEQLLLAAPLIIRDDAERGADRQEVVLLLHDFTFTPPAEIFERLVAGDATEIDSAAETAEVGILRTPPAPNEAAGGMDGMPMGGMAMGGAAGGMAMDGDGMATGDGMAMGEGGMAMGGPGAGAMIMDLNDVTFDAYLANDRTLDDPEVVAVERGGRVRLRVINAASSTNFWLDLGALTGTVVAVDGRDVAPVTGSRFELAMAQRLDIDLALPRDAAAFPILAQREGDRPRTGIVLAAPGARVSKLASEAEAASPPVQLQLERWLVAAEPLAGRPLDRAIITRLTGDMAAYVWGMDGRVFEERVPLEVRRGERVEITMINDTMMSHPMHLHGHHFQVVGIGNDRLAGAMRDTVLVPAMERVTIAFDADNPGEWPLHCHNLYHQEAGMMTTIRYV